MCTKTEVQMRAYAKWLLTKLLWQVFVMGFVLITLAVYLLDQVVGKTLGSRAVEWMFNGVPGKVLFVMCMAWLLSRLWVAFRTYPGRTSF